MAVLARADAVELCARLGTVPAYRVLRGPEAGLVMVRGRTGGGGRRYSHRDIELLREIAHLTSGGVGIEGVRRILELEHQVAALQARGQELAEELAATREALRQARTARRTEPDRLPVLRRPDPGAAVVVWRRGRGQ